MFAVVKNGAPVTKPYQTRGEAELAGVREGYFRVVAGRMEPINGAEIKAVPPKVHSGIKKGVALPKMGAGYFRLDELEIGDSIFVQSTREKVSKLRSAISARGNFLRRKHGKKFSTRVLAHAEEVFEDEQGLGIGVWRME